MYQYLLKKDWRYGTILVLMALVGVALMGCGGGGGGSSSSGDTTGGGTTGGGTTGGGDTGGGDTGGGDTGGGTEMAFLTGNVSYPSSGLTKPFINASGKKSFKVKVSDEDMTGRGGATVHAFYYDENGNKVETPIEATTLEDDPATTENEAGNFEFTALDPTLYDDKLLSIEASFPSLTDASMEVTIRQLIDMSDYELGVTSVECNPITEAILQQIIGLFAQYNITLTPTQLSAFAVLINQIVAAVEAQLAAGGFEMDETNYYSGSIDQGGAGEELGFLAGTDAMITQYETTSLMAIMTDEQKTAKIIEFLCLMGFSVTAPGNKVYTMMDQSYFNCWYQSNLGTNQWGWNDWAWGEIEIDPTLVPGFENAVYAGATETYQLAKGIFVVDPSLLFVDEMSWGYDANWNWVYTAGSDKLVDELQLTTIDANGDGTLNDTVYFDMWKKQQLYYELTNMPPLSMEFVTAFQANLASTTTVADIASAVAANFQWMRYDTSWMDYYGSPDTTATGGGTTGGGTSGTPMKANSAGTAGSMDSYYIGTVAPLKNQSGQIVPVKDFELMTFFTNLNDTDTGKLPTTPLALATKIASGNDIVLSLYQDCLNDVMQKVYELNNQHMMDTTWTWLDPWAEVNEKMVDIDTIRNFVTDKTSFTTFTVGTTTYSIIRKPIWESQRDKIKNIIFVSIPSELLGTTLADTTSVNMTTAFVLTKMVVDKKFRIDANSPWVKTNTSSWYDWVTDTTVTDSWTEVDWSNVKWLETKQTVVNPLKELFTAMVPAFAPAGDVWMDETLAMQIETYGLMFSFDWTGGGSGGGGDTGGGGGGTVGVPADTSYDTWTDTDGDWVNEVLVDISGQIVKSDANYNAMAISGATVTLYTVDWSWAGGDAKGTDLGTATTSDYGVFVFSGLNLYTDYIASFSDNGQAQEYWFYTDPWSNYVVVQDDETLPNPDIDLDADGLYDTYTIHIGMSSGDPLPGVETADNWKRSYPYWAWTNTTGGGGTGGGDTGGGTTNWFYPAWGYMYDYKNNTYYSETTACDFSIGNSWDWLFYVSDLADPRSNMMFTGYDTTGASVNQLSFLNGAVGYDVSEAYLGSTINDINNNKATKWTDYAGLKANCTELTAAVTVSSPWDYYGNYMPSVFLVETNETLGTAPIGYAYLVEVSDVYEWTWDESIYDYTTYAYVTQSQSEVSFSFAYAMIDMLTGEIKYPENLDQKANAKSAADLWPLVDGSVYTYDAETVNVTLTTVPVLNVPGYAFAGIETWYFNLDAAGNMRLLATEKPGTEIAVYTDSATLENGLLFVPADAFSGWSHWSNYDVDIYDTTVSTTVPALSFTTSYSANLWDYTDWSVYPTPPMGDYSGNSGTVSGCLSLNISLYASVYDPVTYYYTTLQNEYDTFLLAPTWGLVDAYGSDYMNYDYWEEYLLNASVPPNTLVLNDVSGTILNATYKWSNSDHKYFGEQLDYYGTPYMTSIYESSYALSFAVEAGSSITSADVSFLVYDSTTWYTASKVLTLTKNVTTGMFEGTYSFPTTESPYTYADATVNVYSTDPLVAADTWYVYVNGYNYPAWVNQPYSDWYLYAYVLYSTDPTFKFDYIYGADSWALTVYDSTASVVFTTDMVTNDATNPYLVTDPYYYYQNNQIPVSTLTLDANYTVVVEAWYGTGSYTATEIDFTYKP